MTTPLQPEVLTGLRGLRLVILGGAGFLGEQLARRARELGGDVLVGDLRALDPDLALEGVERRLVDICGSPDELESCLEGAAVVWNLAGRSGPLATLRDPEGSLEVNVRGSLQVLQATRRVAPSARLVFASSRLVYGCPRELPVTTDHPTAPTSFYGVHKLAAEFQHRLFTEHHDLATTVLRLTNPYGPRRPGATSFYGIVNWFCERALRGEDLSVYGDGSQRRDYVYLDDVVEALLLAGAHPEAAGRTYNVGGGAGIPFVEMARQVLETVEAVGRGGASVTFQPWPAAAARLETGDFVADLEPTARDLGWRPQVELALGLRRTIDCYLEYGASPGRGESP